MSRFTAFAFGALTGAALLIALTWGYVLYDAWSAEHQREAQ